MALPKDAIQYARRVLGSVRRIPFSDSRLIDLSDRLALLTVVVGLRDVAAFGFAEGDNRKQIAALGKILEGQGLHSLDSSHIRDIAIAESRKDVIGNLAEVFRQIDLESDAKNPGRLLWVCRNPDKFGEIRGVIDGRTNAGELLSYPACCVSENRDRSIRSGQAFAKAILKAVGEDPAVVERALREDLKVHIPDGEQVFDACNVSKTTERFPFVFHVACDACLASVQSPTAEKNRDYEAAALQFDRSFHRLLVEITKIEGEIHRIVDEAEARGLVPGQLDRPTNERLQKLFSARDRIHDRIVNGA